MAKTSIASKIHEIELRIASKEEKDHKEALAMCNNLVKEDPSNSILHYWRAKACSRLEDWTEALKSSEIAIKGGAYPLESSKLKSLIEEKILSSKEEPLKLDGKKEEDMTSEIVSEGTINPEELKQFSKYINWVKSFGADLSKVALKYFSPDYRGIVAKKILEKEEIIINIPKDAIITLAMAKKGPVGMEMEKKKVDLIYPNNSMLSSYVLTEMAKEKSPWSLLFDAFPKSVSNFPIFFTQAELKLLEGSPFLPEIHILKEDMEKDYNRICQAAPQFLKHSLTDFMRIRSLVNSRIFGTTIDGIENDSIVPFADMFNYKYESDMTHWIYDEEKEGFIITAKEEIKNGEEIFVYYGNKPNLKFFLFYGFVIENNDNDLTELSVFLDPNDPLHLAKEQLLDQECNPMKLKIGADTNTTRFDKMIGYLRFLEFRGDLEYLEKLKEEWEKPGPEGEEKKPFKAQNFPIISLENERKVLHTLKKLCEEALNRYPTTYEFDLDELKKTDLSFNYRNCLIFRSSEKKIFKFYVDLANSVLPMLNDALEKPILNENFATNMRKYINSIKEFRKIQRID